MSVNTDLREVFRAFHEGRMKRINIYLEGFGGFFLSRVKDGFVVGYVDRNKRIGIDDHATVFYGKRGLEGLHRKVSDSQNAVYMRPEAVYMTSPEGLGKLLQDMQRRKDISAYGKIVTFLVYQALGVGLRQGLKMGESGRVRLLDDVEAQKKGLRSPGLYLKPSFLEMLLLRICGVNIFLQNYMNRLVCGDQSTRPFVEQDFPGVRITRHPKRRR